MKSTLRKKAVAAVMLLAPLGAAIVAQPAAAQTTSYRAAHAEQGRIRNMSINSDAGLRPGATLRLQAYGTPGARWANVMLGHGVRVALHERAPGDYVGTHVVRRSDRIDPGARMTVRAGWGERPVSVAFNFPPSFQSLAMGAAPAAVQVQRFAMWPRGDEALDPGRVVHFRLEGTPNARAWVNVPDVVRSLPLHEVRPGVYLGRYTIRGRDDADAFRAARAVLRYRDQRVTARLGGEHYGYGYGR